MSTASSFSVILALKVIVVAVEVVSVISMSASVRPATGVTVVRFKSPVPVAIVIVVDIVTFLSLTSSSSGLLATCVALPHVGAVELYTGEGNVAETDNAPATKNNVINSSIALNLFII